MTIGAIAQDKSLKLPVPDVGGDAGGTEDDAGGFLKLMSGLLGGGEAKSDAASVAATLGADAGGIVAAAGDKAAVLAEAESAEGATRADASVSPSVGAVNLLLSQLLSREINVDTAVKAKDVRADDAPPVNAPTAADPSVVVSLQAALAGILQGARGSDAAIDGALKSDIVLLAQAIAKSAGDAQGVAADVSASKSNEGAEFRGVKATLEAWVKGPSAIAAPTTGAQDKAPLQLSVVGVATHFAPAKLADGSVAKVEVKAAVDQVLAPAAQTAVAPSAAAITAQAGDKSPDDGNKEKPEPDHGKGEVAVELTTGSAETAEPAVLPIGLRVDGTTPVAKQIAQQVVSSLQGHRPVTSLPGESLTQLSKLKILHIQLQPENLGSVTVRLELRADVLELRIDAQKAETAELLRRDREVLSSLMKAAGYSADDANIRVTHGDPVMAQLTPAVSDTSSAQAGLSQGGGSQSQSAGERAANSQNREGSGRREQPQGEANREAERAPAQLSSGSSVYL